MNIRKASKKDEKELIQMMVDFDNAMQDVLSPVQQKIRAYKDVLQMATQMTHDYLTKRKYTVFVVEDNGKLVGYTCGEIKEKKLRVHNKEGYVSDLYVEAKYQKKGVGKKLLNILIEEFKKKKCTHVALETHIENMNAVGFYEHEGFIKRLVTFFKLIT